MEMVRHGFPKEHGPIAVMLSDHVEGRSHVAVLVGAGEGNGPLTDEERREVTRHAFIYIPLLRAHIQKEDNVLYPMAANALPPAVMAELAAQFKAHETLVMESGAHEALHRLAEELCSAYPPDPAKVSGSSCAGCGGD